MLRRVRTTKNLAKRIDMEYFARPHPMRRWRFILSLAIPLISTDLAGRALDQKP